MLPVGGTSLNSFMRTQIKSIGIVGGGTAGFVAALILKKRFPDIKIDMIRSSKIGIIGVGEGSTEHWKQFMEYVGIDTYDLIKECDATCKIGIMFDNWVNKPYLHSVQDEFAHFAGQYPYIYANQIAYGSSSQDMSKKTFWENNVETWYKDQPTRCPSAQFHFNTNKLNEFLTNLTLKRGVNIIDDEIEDILLDEHGNINSLKGTANTYTHDFYIDCTGFKRMLISKLGGKWVSYGKYLKMKAAIAFPTPDTENYNIWTLARAMDYGWMFRLPVWGRHGNGYIFDSDYIDADQAKQEAEKYLGFEVDVGKTFKFDPGALENVWIKNCVAVGVSASFVEPMEASSIGTSIQQSFLLMHRLANYDEHVIKSYNKSVNDILENIRDFVILHYLTGKQSNNFWKDVSNLEIPDSLKYRLELWRHKMPTKEDFSDLSNFILFAENNWTLVMQGLGLFDKESIKNELLAVEPSMQQHALTVVNEVKKYESTVQTFTHKEYIRSIREFKNDK